MQVFQEAHQCCWIPKKAVKPIMNSSENYSWLLKSFWKLLFRSYWKNFCRLMKCQVWRNSYKWRKLCCPLRPLTYYCSTYGKKTHLLWSILGKLHPKVHLRIYDITRWYGSCLWFWRTYSSRWHEGQIRMWPLLNMSGLCSWRCTVLISYPWTCLVCKSPLWLHQTSPAK